MAVEFELDLANHEVDLGRVQLTRLFDEDRQTSETLLVLHLLELHFSQKKVKLWMRLLVTF